MSSKYTGFAVTLDRDISEEECEKITSAISQIKGVVSVKPCVYFHDAHIARLRAKTEISNLLLDLAQSLANDERVKIVKE
jgi:hypothetical protein